MRRPADPPAHLGPIRRSLQGQEPLPEEPDDPRDPDPEELDAAEDRHARGLGLTEGDAR